MIRLKACLFLDFEVESAPVNVRFCWRYEPSFFVSPPFRTVLASGQAYLMGPLRFTALGTGISAGAIAPSLVRPVGRVPWVLSPRPHSRAKGRPSATHQRPRALPSATGCARVPHTRRAPTH